MALTHSQLRAVNLCLDRHSAQFVAENPQYAGPMLAARTKLNGLFVSAHAHHMRRNRQRQERKERNAGRGVKSNPATT